MPRKPSSANERPNALKIDPSEPPSSSEMPQKESTPSPTDRMSSSQSEPQQSERLIVMYIPRRKT